MNEQSNQSDGQGGIDQETELRNQENETGQQSGQQFGQQSGQQFGQQSDQQFGQQSAQQSGQQTDQQFGQQPQTSTESSSSESESGFVGSSGDQSSDYLTEGDSQDFQPEGQGASDSNSGDADMTTGQPTSSDSTLDDGSDTSR